MLRLASVVLRKCFLKASNEMRCISTRVIMGAHMTDRNVVQALFMQLRVNPVGCRKLFSSISEIGSLSAV